LIKSTIDEALRHGCISILIAAGERGTPLDQLQNQRIIFMGRSICQGQRFVVISHARIRSMIQQPKRIVGSLLDDEMDEQRVTAGKPRIGIKAKSLHEGPFGLAVSPVARQHVERRLAFAVVRG